MALMHLSKINMVRCHLQSVSLGATSRCVMQLASSVHALDPWYAPLCCPRISLQANSILVRS